MLKLAHNLVNSADVDFIKQYCFEPTRLKAIHPVKRLCKTAMCMYLICISSMIGCFTKEQLEIRYHHLKESTLKSTELTSWANLWIIKSIPTLTVDLLSFLYETCPSRNQKAWNWASGSHNYRRKLGLWNSKICFNLGWTLFSVAVF